MKKSGTESEKKKSSSDDLRLAIVTRIGDLTRELQEQQAVKEAIKKKAQEIDVRCTQIVGAIHELQKIQKMQEPKEEPKAAEA